MTERGQFPEEVATPIGWDCAECGRPIEEGDRGRIVRWEGPEPKVVAYHETCFDEATSAGIGG